MIGKGSNVRIEINCNCGCGGNGKSGNKEETPKTPTLELKSTEVFNYEVPKNTFFFGVELKGSGTVQVSNNETELGNLGDITGNDGDILQTGLQNVKNVYFKADADISVIPILYKK